MKRTLILLILFALAACAKPPQGELATPAAPAAALVETPTAPAAASALSAHHWRLTDAKDASGHRIESLFVNAGKPLQLDFAAGRVGIGNTCNRMGGAYSAQGDQLKLDKIASTMMACADSRLMALDQEAAARLQGASTFVLQPGVVPTLTLTTGGGDVLVLKGEPNADARYGGPGETAFLEIAALTRACSHPLIPDMQCLQVRELKYDEKGMRTGDDGDFGNFYASIQGYQHQPGARDVLRVKRYRIKNPPGDGSALAYELDMVVESETLKP